MESKSEVIRHPQDNGPKSLTFQVFVYDGPDITAKLVEWYSVATSRFVTPEIKKPEGYRVWISEWKMK